MIISLLYFILAAQACPSYQCESLPDKVCITWVENSINFNSNGCGSSKLICSLSKAMIAYNFNPKNGTFYCEDSSNFPTTQGYSYCGTQEITKENLKSGSYPQSCTEEGFTDSACELEDGSFVECTCGFDSLLYCKPNPSSSVYSEFWNECQANDDVVTAEFYQYYETLYEYYVDFNTKLDCSSTLFKEISIVSGLVPKSSIGHILSIAAVVLSMY